jgi:hypothetical protein
MKNTYNLFLERITSSDKKKIKRAITGQIGLDYFRDRMNRYGEGQKKELEILEGQISLRDFPEASNILKSLDIIARSILCSVIVFIV